MKRRILTVSGMLAVGILVGLHSVGCSPQEASKCTETLREWVVHSETTPVSDEAESAPKVNRLAQQSDPTCAFRGPEGEEAAVFILRGTDAADDLRVTVVDALEKASYTVASEVDGDDESAVTLLGPVEENPPLAMIRTFWVPPSTWNLESNSIVVLIAVS